MNLENSEIKQLVLNYLEGKSNLDVIHEYEKKISYLDYAGLIEFNYMENIYLAVYNKIEPMHKGADDIYIVNYCELIT